MCSSTWVPWIARDLTLLVWFLVPQSEINQFAGSNKSYFRKLVVISNFKNAFWIMYCEGFREVMLGHCRCVKHEWLCLSDYFTSSSHQWSRAETNGMWRNHERGSCALVEVQSQLQESFPSVFPLPEVCGTCSDTCTTCWGCREHQTHFWHWCVFVLSFWTRGSRIGKALTEWGVKK